MVDSIQLKQPTYLIEDYNQLVTNAVEWLRYVSGGLIDASNTFSVARYLLEAQVWAFRELEFYAEELPTAGVFQFLDSVVGVRINNGTKAKVLMEVTLEAIRSTSFFLPQGYQISTSENLQYFTTQSLTIPAGNLVGTVIAEASEEGTIYNVPAYAINRVFVEYAGLKTIQNIEPAAGGTNQETENEAIIRGAREIRRRENLISKDDVEDFSQEYLGTGSYVKIVEWYEEDGSNRPGEVEVYALSADGTPVNTAISYSLQTELGNRLPLGLFATVRKLELLYVDCVVNAEITSFSNPDKIADELYNTFLIELGSSKISAGETLRINKIISSLSNNAEVILISSLILNNSSLDIIMPTAYTISYPGTFIIYLMDESGSSYGPYIYGTNPNSDLLD